MGDAIRTGAASSKPKEAPKAASKPKTAPKRNTRNISAAEKNKAPVPETVAEDEEDKEHVLRKLKPKIPDHNDAHPVADRGGLRIEAMERVRSICHQKENCCGLQVPYQRTAGFL